MCCSGGGSIQQEFQLVLMQRLMIVFSADNADFDGVHYLECGNVVTNNFTSKVNVYLPVQPAGLCCKMTPIVR